MTLHVLYNGACPICSREIGHYRRIAARHGAPLAFDDLNAVDLRPWGLDADRARRRLHARRGSEVLIGLDAFRALWAQLPGWRWLARLTGLPLIEPASRALYDGLLAPWLYRRSARACKAATQGVCMRAPGP